MLSREEKKTLRSIIFRQLDGIVMAPTAYLLHEKKVTDYLLTHKRVEVSELSKHFAAQEGYMNVALRLLSSQGWLTQDIDNKANKVFYETNEKSEEAFSLFSLYEDVNALIKFSNKFHRRKFELEPFLKLEKIMERYRENYGLGKVDEQSIAYQVLKHIEGIVIGPTIVALGMSGMFHKYFLDSSFHPGEFHADVESFEKILDFMAFLGWFNKRNGNYSFTDTGLFFARRAAAYGVTVSYLPTLSRLDKLIFEDPSVLRVNDASKEEVHVDRAMNVWGSGGAHSTYFKKIDQVLIDIFNQPLEDQPKGILDMGCGNGAFLIHAYNVIESRTLRGEVLEDYPLFLVGADYNKAALDITRQNIVKNDIWAKVIWGDIGDPDLLATSLKNDFSIDLSDLLNVRTFLDHNRIWSEGYAQDSSHVSDSTGSFAFKGKRISNNQLELNLKSHFESWFPYVSKHGLLLVELHTVDPSLVSENIGNTPVTAYDGTHGYSDQYILELSCFKRVAESAGFEFVNKYAYRFPDSDLASVSINLLKGKS